MGQYKPKCDSLGPEFDEESMSETGKHSEGHTVHAAMLASESVSRTTADTSTQPGLTTQERWN
ncbi:hypothetical protein E2C01_004048 [Portunus trituberculatus]|uniref:Uncharacterized protein n=1 Tax=Portunus trituberculatus TaxID=210409 RepID=A0A5B7CSY3_PORTR|nr:hypothetical protein [Portunus trituberculatus]